MKFSKKIFSVGALLSIFLSANLDIYANSKFSDVSNNHWAIQEINEFQNKGIINGYEDNTFKPNNNITRGEFMKIISKAFEIDTLNTSVNSNFIDIKSHWAEEYIKNSVSNGAYDYVLDSSLNSKFRFRPNDYITREEAFTILATYLGINDRYEINRLPYFVDNKDISYWAKQSIEGLIEYDLLKGYENKTINPKGKLTRAEVVKLIDRVEEIGKATNVLYENYSEGSREDLTYIYANSKELEIGNKDILDNFFYVFIKAYQYDTDSEIWSDTVMIVRKNDYKVFMYDYYSIYDPDTGEKIISFDN